MSDDRLSNVMYRRINLKIINRRLFFNIKN